MDPLGRLEFALPDRYRVARQIGGGGQATVYRAREIPRNRTRDAR